MLFRSYGFLPNVAMGLYKGKDVSTKTQIVLDNVANKTAGMVLPGFVKQIATSTDVKGGGFQPFGETIKRWPKGEGLDKMAQYFMMGIPGLRQYVPESGEKGAIQVKDPSTFKLREMTEAEKNRYEKSYKLNLEELKTPYIKYNAPVFIDVNDVIHLPAEDEEETGGVSQEEKDTWKEIPYNKLDDKQRKKVMSLIESKAKRDAKETLFQ